MILSYPETGSPSLAVTLRNAQFGNAKNVDTGAIVRESRHGYPLAYKDSSWPVLKTRTYTTTTNKLSVINDLKDFLEDTAGLKIKITDHDDVDITGIIITSSNQIVTRKDSCSYDVSFDFLEIV